MKIIMISSVPLFPTISGNAKRIVNEIKVLKTFGWSIDLFFYGRADQDLIERMRNLIKPGTLYYSNGLNYNYNYEMNRHFREKNNEQPFLKMIKVRCKEDEYFHCRLIERINSIIKQNNYEAVWLQYFYMSKLLEDIDSTCLKIIDTHDRYGKRDLIFERCKEEIVDIYLSTLEERKALKRADVILV